MSHPGRHRAEQSRARSGQNRRTPIVAIAAVGAVLVVVAAWTLAHRTSDDPPPAVAESPEASPGGSASTSPSGSPSASASMVDTQRTVTIQGDRVIVEETSTVVGGAATRAVPTSVATSGLRALSASVLTADGRSRPFDNTVTLSAAGSLTIRARYRLTDCPDLLPVQWPTPSSFPDATRTFSRLDEPLHTAYALCSTAKSRARPLDGLTGTVVAGPVPTVRLAWNGDAPLTISTIGSASGVAVIAVEPGCDGGCVAEIPASGYATLPLQPIDPCPPATDDDIMTLAIERHAMTSVRVFGLAAAVCH